MKAMRFHEVGGPEVLRYEDVEKPEPGKGQVRIRVAGSAFSPADNGMRAGILPIPITLPHVPGYDVSGTVDAVGPEVDGFRPGDSVIGFLPMSADGSAAEYAIAPADVLVAAPTRIPLVDSAAFPSVALTAWQALFAEAGLEAGQRVLIVGAGGAVGGYAVQLAKRAGAHVIATASPRSGASVTAAGADEVIDHTATSLRAAVTHPVDVLLNLAPLEPEEFAGLVEVVRDGGVVVSTTAWMPAPGDDGRGVRGVVIYVRPDTEVLSRLVGLIDSGDLQVEVSRRVPLSELASVHAEAASGTLRGKVVAIPPAA
ncbi:MAG TPA: NADP-dependent oxidoreductase [Naasia sp.]